jgi:hypothetical protein
VAEVTAQLPRGTRAGAGLGGHDILVCLRIICRLRRRPLDGTHRHCDAFGAGSGTQMSHYIFRQGGPLGTVALAVPMLSRGVALRPAATALVAGGRLAQLLPATQLPAVPRAVNLSAVAGPTNPNDDPAASAVKEPKLRLHLPPPCGTGQRRGEQAYRACGEAPTGAPQRRGPGVEWYRSPGPRFIYPSIAKVRTRSASDRLRRIGKCRSSGARCQTRWATAQAGRTRRNFFYRDAPTGIEAAASAAPPSFHEAPPPKRPLAKPSRPVGVLIT